MTVTVAVHVQLGIELAVEACVADPVALVVAAEADVVSLVCAAEVAEVVAVLLAIDVGCKSTPVTLAVVELATLVVPAETEDAVVDTEAEAVEAEVAVVVLPVP